MLLYVYQIYLTFIEVIMNRVKEFRVKLNMSQLQLSREIDVSRQAINMIENDKYNPSLELCIKLAKALHTDLNSLFWNTTTGEQK